jgi:hypothetical protein
MASYFTSTQITPGRARWMLVLGFASLACFAGALVAFFEHLPFVATYALIGCGVCMGLGAEIRFHGFLITFAVVMAPLVLVAYKLNQNREVWHSWPFWVLTAGCEIVGGAMLLWLMRTYPRGERL